jgi:hypothetical protein
MRGITMGETMRALAVDAKVRLVYEADGTGGATNLAAVNEDLDRLIGLIEQCMAEGRI